MKSVKKQNKSEVCCFHDSLISISEIIIPTQIILAPSVNDPWSHSFCFGSFKNVLQAIGSVFGLRVISQFEEGAFVPRVI